MNDAEFRRRAHAFLSKILGDDRAQFEYDDATECRELVDAGASGGCITTVLPSANPITFNLARHCACCLCGENKPGPHDGPCCKAKIWDKLIEYAKAAPRCECQPLGLPDVAPSWRCLQCGRPMRGEPPKMVT